MSNIEELIMKLCPNGVPYIKLKEMAEIGTGNSDRKDAVEKGEFPFYVRSKDILRINKYEYDETAIIIPGEGGIGEIFHYVEGKYSLHQRAYRIHVLDSRLNTKYLYYYMFSMFKNFIMKKAVTATVTSIRKPMIEEFPIPVPPLEVQCEIVHILDDFTLLSAELSAELKARRIQYEYYRDKLLEPKEDWNCIQMNDICEIITKQTGFDYSATIKPALVTEKNDNTLSFIQNKDFCGEYFNYDTDYYIPKNIVERFPKITLDKPSILFSISGKIGNIGLFEKKEKAFIGGAICICKLKEDNPIINRYILYYSQSKYGQKYLFKSIKAASHLNITVESIRNMKIYYPNKEQQEQIVSKLMKLDKLCNDIFQGLPAEIEARKKQYEYYRDKLLTFKELKVEE